MSDIETGRMIGTVVKYIALSYIGYKIGDSWMDKKFKKTKKEEKQNEVAK